MSIINCCNMNHICTDVVYVNISIQLAKQWNIIQQILNYINMTWPHWNITQFIQHEYESSFFTLMSADEVVILLLTLCKIISVKIHTSQIAIYYIRTILSSLTNRNSSCLRIRAMHEANTALLDILVDNSVY